MACKTIKNMLSEYLDDTLDRKNKALVAAHLSSCKDCREELKTIKTLSSQLQQLPSRTAPDDFLEHLHQKIHPTPWWKRLYRVLFVPFRIKFPLELATATAVAGLAFFVFTVQQQDTRIGPSVRMKKEGSTALAPPKTVSDVEAAAGKTGSGGQAEEKGTRDAKAPLSKLVLADKSAPPNMPAGPRQAPPLPAASEAGAQKRNLQQQKKISASPMPPPSRFGAGTFKGSQTVAVAPEKNEIPRPKPIALALFLDLAAPAELPSAPISRLAGAPKAEIQEGASQGAVKEDLYDRPANEAQPVDMISEIKEVAGRLGGRLVYVEHDPVAQTPFSLQINIPSSAYEDFCNAIAAFGTLRSPTPKLGENPPDPLTITLLLN